MNNNLTHIVVVLDRSGSMRSICQDTIGGYNTFLDAQRKAPGEAAITLVQFDNEYELLYRAKPIKDAPGLSTETYIPRGSTALLDAIGRTINTTGSYLSEQKEESRPAKVVFVILTDGEENASHEFSREKIFDMISHQREVYKWEFVFLGANQDAIHAGHGIGVAQAASISMAANMAGTKAAYSSVSDNLLKYRSNVVPDMSWSEDDREAQRKAGAKH